MAEYFQFFQTNDDLAETLRLEFPQTPSLFPGERYSGLVEFRTGFRGEEDYIYYEDVHHWISLEYIETLSNIHKEIDLDRGIFQEILIYTERFLPMFGFSNLKILSDGQPRLKRVYEVFPFKGERIPAEKLHLPDEKGFFEAIQKAFSHKGIVRWNPYNRCIYVFYLQEGYSEFYFLPFDYVTWSFRAQMVLSFFSKGLEPDWKLVFEDFSIQELEGFQVFIDERLESSKS